ncbi:MAG: hypothetical protein KA974_12015 [Saprospiraceae bacterium]|nr:hypothetical protein [Saprospiraceae bacterium]
MEYNEDFLKKMVQVGTLGYPLSKIINVLDIDDIKQFTKDFDNPKSQVAISYQKGVDKADFVLDSKLFDMAKGGDLKALDKYEVRKRNNIYREERESKGR